MSSKPFSSTAKQHTKLIIAGLHKGFEPNEIRRMVGGSIKKLSKAEASYWIERFSGQALPNPPGQKPGQYKGRAPAGVTRMITQDQIDQIERLMRAYFQHRPNRALEWLNKNFKVEKVRDLATARRAGEVIRVLKEMNKRRDAGTKGRRDEGT